MNLDLPQADLPLAEWLMLVAVLFWRATGRSAPFREGMAYPGANYKLQDEMALYYRMGADPDRAAQAIIDGGWGLRF